MTTFFTTTLFAQTAAAPGAGGGLDLMSFLPMILIFGVFYFLLIRPQQKKAQEQRSMIAAIQRGDRVLTAGGLIGLVTKVVNDQEVQLELADGVRVRLVKSMVLEVMGKNEASSKETHDGASNVQSIVSDAKTAPKAAAKVVKKPAVAKTAKK
jgi:preprotein translocase subunit YajC